jgi:molybdopterin-guanine dinucleotide biosynthesis protein A
MILGCVLAGGLSSRFGSDKALAEWNGRTLIAIAVDTLAGHCDHVIVAGRALAPAPTIPDWPRPGMGPLAGLAAALRFAEDEDYASVLTCGVDSVGLPDDLLEILSPAPAYLETQPVVGHWTREAASIAAAILQSEGRHSMQAFARAAGVRAVKSVGVLANVNTPADLATLGKPRGQKAETEQNDGI